MRTIAAFDFDGTLSTRDNLIPYLRRVAGTARVNRALVQALPALVTGHRDAAKGLLIRTTLRGRERSELDEVAESFAAHVVARHLRPDVVERADWHRAQGHERFIVSASLASFLRPISSRLGFDAVLATEVEFDAGRCTGGLVGANVRGREKVRRLDSWLGDEPATVWAYGDSSGDAALLARADRPVRVGRRRLQNPPPSGPSRAT